MASFLCFREIVFHNRKNNRNPVTKYFSMTCNCRGLTLLVENFDSWLFYLREQGEKKVRLC